MDTGPTLHETCLRGKPRDGGQRCDIWRLRAARHRSCLVALGLRDGGRRTFAFCRERLISLFGPERPRPFALIALELVGHPEQCAVDHDAVIAGEIHDPSLDHETAEFDKVARALAAIDLPCAHVMPRPCGLMPVALRLVAPERRRHRGHLPMQFAATLPERTRPRVSPMPPAFRCPWFRPVRSMLPPGILNNELYAGVLVWNRQRFVKDPATGKRVSRPNPESQWIRAEVRHLKIVDDELWQAARARQQQISAIFGPNPANTREGRAERLHLANRPVSLLSGLLTCGCCAGRIGILTPNRYGCLNHHRRGTCANNRTITRDKIEARVLAGLKDRLVSSEAVAEAVRAYAEEMNRLNHDRRAQAETDHRALQKIERAVAGIMAAIEDGLYQPSMKARMDGLELQKAEITERLSQARADLPDVHPNIANAYRKNVARFTEVLADPDGGREAAEALRSLIGGIVLNPARSVARSTLSCAAS